MKKIKFKMQFNPFLLDTSPWPFLLSGAVFMVTTAFVMAFHLYNSASIFITFGLISFIFLFSCWIRDVLREGNLLGWHTMIIKRNLRYGFMLFIVSEVMFFVGFFWAYFHSSLSPVFQIGSYWPPLGIFPFDPWGVPFFNTVVLLSSGASTTWVHYALVSGEWEEVVFGFGITLGLAFVFLASQVYEYVSAAFGISDSVFGSCFYMLTGFHGFHVLVGTIFLLISLIRFVIGHFTPYSHAGFVFAAWYWHFVDVVWLFLFVIVYLYTSL